MALAAFALVLWSGSAAAQNDVTFQVNLQPFLTACQFTPATETAFVRGSFNGYDTSAPLTDVGNGIYATTLPIAAGNVSYKFYVGQAAVPSNEGILGWENNVNDGGESANDRDYVVTDGGPQTVPVAEFNKPVVNSCGSTANQYDIIFAVDMSIQQAIGFFDPATQTVGAVGGFQGWDTNNPVVLTADSGQPGLYTGIYQGTFNTPQGGGLIGSFKFIIRDPNTTPPRVDWDSINPIRTPRNTGGGDPDRVLEVTGNETDLDGNGFLDFLYDNDTDPSTFPFFRDQTTDDFTSAPTTITFNVDMRPAQYRIADSGALPPVAGSDPSTGNTAINTVSINGPAAGLATQDSQVNDWAGWGAELAAIPNRQLADADADGVYTLTLDYPAGTPRLLVAKFGVNGADDEALAATNHNFPLSDGVSTFDVKFGCMLQVQGNYVDDAGFVAGGPNAPYDEYLLVNNQVQPETCSVVRNGGLEGDIIVASESAPSIAGLAISAAYPNPATTAGRIDLTLDRAMMVSVRVYDVTGRQVATLVDGREVGAGTTTLSLDTARLASGVYVLRVEADGQVASRRLTVTR